MNGIGRIAFAAAIAAVATSGVAQDTVPASAPAQAEIATKSGTLGAPAPGHGQVVFYRTGTIVGAALGCTVHEGAGTVARLGAGKYYAVAVAPGKHQYSTEGEAKDVLNLEVESDETYFVRCSIGMGVMSGRANLSPSDRAAFAAKAKGLALWKGPKT